MPEHYGNESNSSIEKSEHDDLLDAKRVTDVGSDLQEPWDDTSTPNVIYTGMGGRGIATSSGDWMITKTDFINKTSKHATGAWDDRTSLTYT